MERRCQGLALPGRAARALTLPPLLLSAKELPLSPRKGESQPGQFHYGAGTRICFPFPATGSNWKGDLQLPRLVDKAMSGQGRCVSGAQHLSAELARDRSKSLLMHTKWVWNLEDERQGLTLSSHEAA